MISSAYKLCAKMIEDEFPPVGVEHLSVPLLRRRQLVGRRHRPRASSCLKTHILPKVNLFCYGQVESPYGSGQFIKDLQRALRRGGQPGRLGDQGQGSDHGVDPRLPGQGEVEEAAVARSRPICATSSARSKATRASFGLDFWDVEFEILDYKRMNEVAAFGGFPVRYPHWRFGMEFEHLTKSHVYGLSKIYEMVINNNPAYAYLLEGNSLVDQKMVMAHVLGHVDFFKNNYFFSKTNRRMIDGMANHATRVRRHMERLGLEKVESFIDACLSLENLIDPMSPFIVRKAPPEREKERQEQNEPQECRAPRQVLHGQVHQPARLHGRAAAQDGAGAGKPKKNPPEPGARRAAVPAASNAPLERWERDVLEIVRDEAYYFAPQRQTKIMNEGWAAYWHSQDHDREGAEGLRDHRLRRPQRRRAGDGARPVQPLQDRHRAASQHRGALGQGPVRQGVERVPEPRRAARPGTAARPRAQEDLRGAQALQRRHLHRRVLHRRLLRARTSSSRSRCNERSGNYEIDSREFKKIKDKLLFSADQLRRAVHLRRGRQLREPRRAPPPPPARRDRSRRSTRPARRWRRSAASGAAR